MSSVCEPKHGVGRVLWLRPSRQTTGGFRFPFDTICIACRHRPRRECVVPGLVDRSVFGRGSSVLVIKPTGANKTFSHQPFEH